jgi:hypothetical protein
MRVATETLGHTVVVAVVDVFVHMLPFQRHGPPVRLFLGIVVGGVCRVSFSGIVGEGIAEKRC